MSKPPLHWFEGTLYFFDGKTLPSNADDWHRMGFAQGRQVVGLYIVEMLLKRALDKHGIKYLRTHNLHALFMKLLPQEREKAQKKYKRILNNEVEEGWDVEKTVKSFLTFLGENPITDSRYFWDLNPDENRKNDVVPFFLDSLRRLIYALFIALHDYPVKAGSLKKRYNTMFRPFEKSK